MSVLIYIHVPFCRSKCSYCSFYSVTPGKDANDHINAYVAALQQEIVVRALHRDGVVVDSVFFGGGTPSLLPSTCVSDILSTLSNSFCLSSSAEVSMEANPESALTGNWLEDIRAAGVNRLSFGVQSLQDTMLRLLGRRHTALQAFQAVARAKSAGFSSVSVDMMWGLPSEAGGQTRDAWLEELHACVNQLQPDHISAYGLSLEPESPLARSCVPNRLHLPQEEELTAMFITGAEYLESCGLFQYEISNFARHGHQCRHNIGYWEGADYLGFGPAATSTVDNVRVTNAASIAKWHVDVAHHRCGSESATGEFEPLDSATIARERLMLQLRMSKGVHLAEWNTQVGWDFLQVFAELSEALQQNDLARIEGDRFFLTRAGMLVSNMIIERFFDAFPNVKE